MKNNDEFILFKFEQFVYICLYILVLITPKYTFEDVYLIQYIAVLYLSVF